jgi:hypothetical protein
VYFRRHFLPSIIIYATIALKKQPNNAVKMPQNGAISPNFAHKFANFPSPIYIAIQLLTAIRYPLTATRYPLPATRYPLITLHAIATRYCYTLHANNATVTLSAIRYAIATRYPQPLTVAA